MTGKRYGRPSAGSASSGVMAIHWLPSTRRRSGFKKTTNAVATGTIPAKRLTTIAATCEKKERRPWRSSGGEVSKINPGESEVENGIKAGGGPAPFGLRERCGHPLIIPLPCASRQGRLSWLRPGIPRNGHRQRRCAHLRQIVRQRHERRQWFGFSG